MCGIAVAFQVDAAESRVRAMLARLEHRGDQDDPIQVLDATVAIGTRRLRILDWTNATQPMWSFDGRYLVVLNGQIYNFRSLRAELSREGAFFDTDSDTEVLANGLALWGEKVLGRIRGMFAFVALDRRSNTLIAARDPFGIKPLYFTRRREGILLASEITALLGGSRKGVVEELPPGHYLSEGELRAYESLSPQAVSGASSLSDNAQELSRLLHCAVKQRLPRDLPCAVMFGGGVDSTLVLHIARRFRPRTKAYLVSNEQGRDRPYALEYASKTGGDLTLVDFQVEEIFRLLPEVVLATETFEPNVVRNGVFSFLLARRIHEDGIRVALCGEGADELFCGYPEIARQATAEEMMKARERFISGLHRTQLQRVDRCSMAHTLETRVPFLDVSVAGFALGLEPGHLVRRQGRAIIDKAVLRQIYVEDSTLPRSIGEREKVVFVDGAGMGDNSDSGPFFEHAEDEVSDGEFEKSRSLLPALNFRNKEEVLYYKILTASFDVARVPFMARRPNVNVRGTSRR